MLVGRWSLIRYQKWTRSPQGQIMRERVRGRGVQVGEGVGAWTGGGVGKKSSADGGWEGWEITGTRGFRLVSSRGKWRGLKLGVGALVL